MHVSVESRKVGFARWQPLALARTRTAMILYAGIIPAALVARLLFLGSRSFWLDEVTGIVYSRFDWPEFVRIVSIREANMTLYYCLLRAWLHFGDSEFIVRSLSVIFAVATLPVIYALGARLFGTRVGMASATLLAVNAFHVQYSQTARGYTLLVFLGTLSMLLWIRCVERPGWFNWVAYVFTNVLAFYTHFFTAFVLAGHWASLLFLRHRPVPWKALLLSAIAIGVAVLPLGVFMIANDVGQISWALRPDRDYVIAFWTTLTGGSQIANIVYMLAYGSALIWIRVRNPLISTVGPKVKMGTRARKIGLWIRVRTALLWMRVRKVGAALTLSIGGRRWRKVLRDASAVCPLGLLLTTGQSRWKVRAALTLTIGRRSWVSITSSSQNWHFWVAFTGFWIPLLLPLAASCSFIKPMFVHRFLIICLPAFILLVALGLSAPESKRLTAVALIVVTLVSAYRVVRYQQTGDSLVWRRWHEDDEDWRGATRYVLAQAKPRDALLFYHPYVRQPFEFYREVFHVATEPDVVLPAVWDRSAWEWSIEQAPTETRLDGLPSRYGTVWLVIGHEKVIALDRNIVSGWIEASLKGMYGACHERKFVGIRVLRCTESNRDRCPVTGRANGALGATGLFLALTHVLATAELTSGRGLVLRCALADAGKPPFFAPRTVVLRFIPTLRVAMVVFTSVPRLAWALPMLQAGLRLASALSVLRLASALPVLRAAWALPVLPLALDPPALRLAWALPALRAAAVVPVLRTVIALSSGAATTLVICRTAIAPPSGAATTLPILRAAAALSVGTPALHPARRKNANRYWR